MKYFFITGTSSGLGLALTEEILKDEDTFVYGFSRSNSIQHKRYRHTTIDLSDTDAVKKIAFSAFDTIDATEIFLINNAATIEPVQHAGKQDPESIISSITLNLITPALLSNDFIKTFFRFVKKKVIVNVSSGAASRPVDGWSCYCSTKAGLDMLTKTLAMEQEIEKSGFRIVSIAPGIVDTPMQAAIRDSKPTQFSQVADFIRYKEEGQLHPPRETAQKLLQILHNLKDIKDDVFRITY